MSETVLRCHYDACMADLAAARATIERREAVIRLLERDANESAQRAANALGTRKVLFMLLGECLPLLEFDAQETHCGPSHDSILDLIQRIEDAREAVLKEGLHLAQLDTSDHHGPDWTERDGEYLK